jgi:putative membrane protein
MDVDPDSRARTHLANERTYLAWFRTGITLVALGLAAAQFLAPGTTGGDVFVRGLSLTVIITGAFLLIVGGQRYVQGRRRIDEAAFRPAANSILVTAVAGIVTAVLAALFVLFAPTG